MLSRGDTSHSHCGTCSRSGKYRSPANRPAGIDVASIFESKLSTRTPRFSVSRLIVHESCAKMPRS